MKVSYRASAGAVVVVLVLLAATRSLSVEWAQPAPVSTIDGASVIAFNPCWPLHLTPLAKVAVVVWLGSFVILMTQGLRNRSVPRWLSITSVIAFAFLVYREVVWRQATECYTRLFALRGSLFVLAVGLMCLHQILQRPIQGKPAG
jgi:hypothetical protein